jgi:hypothetical protein
MSRSNIGMNASGSCFEEFIKLRFFSYLGDCPVVRLKLILLETITDETLILVRALEDVNDKKRDRNKLIIIERKLYRSIRGLEEYDKEKESWRILTDKVYNRKEWKKLLRTIQESSHSGHGYGMTN